MKILVLGAGMMGRAIAFDLHRFSEFESIILADQSQQALFDAEHFLKGKNLEFKQVNVNNTAQVKQFFTDVDIVISAIPYSYNYKLTTLAIQTKTHFLDLGGNNTIVAQQRMLHPQAKKQHVVVIPDCGLAPGFTSIITKDIVEQTETVEYVKIRVGGLPQHPQPPLNYQLVFSPYGLINEYVEDALVLDHGSIITKPSMTELETLEFPKPYGPLEAFLTSGGCSTLPYTYKDHVGYLDYKTIRYPGHCQLFKPLLDLGFTSTKPLEVQGKKVIPRELFAQLLLNQLPKNQPDVVLIRVIAKGTKDDRPQEIIYQIIDTYDHKHKLTAMMRTTGYPISIIAQLIQQQTITSTGVHTSEEIIPCNPFFSELKKRKILIEKSYNPL